MKVRGPAAEDEDFREEPKFVKDDDEAYKMKNNRKAEKMIGTTTYDSSALELYNKSNMS
jgi:hypothetical protein